MKRKRTKAPASTLCRFALLISLIFSGTVGTAAQDIDVRQEERPVIGFYNIELGRKYALSTYLSPFSYSGTNLAVSGLWTKALPMNPEHLTMTFEGGMNFGSFLNKARTAREFDIHGRFSWGMLWNKRLPNNFMVGGGGDIGFQGGVLYLPRNGNNPASADFCFGLGISGFASWHTTLGRLPILVTERPRIPLVNGFFMPQFGEPYYEIYLGNRNGLAHCGWWGNHFALDNLLAVSLDFGRTAMQIGYRFSMQSVKANHLFCNMVNHAFVIGVIPGGLGLKNKKSNSVNPLY